MRKEVESRIEALQKELEQILERMPKSDKERRASSASSMTRSPPSPCTRRSTTSAAAFAGRADVQAYLEAAGKDLVRNVGLFLVASRARKARSSSSRPTPPAIPASAATWSTSWSATATTPDAARPIVEELNPTYGNLIGRVEHIAQMGALVTDFLLIKPGALHRANGGYLLIDARKLLLSPFAWEALKRALKAREIRIEQPSEVSGLISTQSLDPEPIPLDVKVVLFGDRELYYLLRQHDPDFAGLFKVQADFDDSIARSAENDRAYARLIASIVARARPEGRSTPPASPA